MKKPIVLFVCTGNSARSQMAEGLLRKYAGDRFDAQSAGMEPKGLNPLAVEAMKELGIDISQHRSKEVSEFLGKAPIQYAIFVCSSADERCPRLWPFAGKRLYWPFEDPAAATGSHAEKLAVFRDIRDQIDGQIIDWLAELQVAGELPAAHS
jgi:arsenate reductase